jgi:hypothetical protein
MKRMLQRSNAISDRRWMVVWRYGRWVVEVAVRSFLKMDLAIMI